MPAATAPEQLARCKQAAPPAWLLVAWLLASLALAWPFAAPQTAEPVQVEKSPKHVSPGGGTRPFQVTRHLIPLREIEGGGPPRDGIPALDHPAFVTVREADRLLASSDMVLGLEFGGMAKAYPVRILNWHEVVNDDVGKQPALVTW